MWYLQNRLVGISSGGGHLKELKDAIPSHYKDVHYITFKNGHTSNSLKDNKHSFVIDPHNSKIKYFVNALQSFFLFIIIRPKVIVSTGAGIAIPFMIIGHIFGSKIIFIETGARIFTPSKTGEFLYKFSDLFIVQYEPLRKKYPHSILGSLQ